MSSIEVHIISNRDYLDKFIGMWEDVVVDKIDCTIKVLTVDYPEKKFVLNNGIKVEYIKQKTFPKTSYMNQAWARNELLCYADSKYVLFFDDWQRPGHNILTEHLKYLEQGFAVCGGRSECDKDGNNCKEDPRIQYGNMVICSYSNYWTCNASAKLNSILDVNGFDNRFNGGSGGEDYDLGMRMSRSGEGGKHGHKIFYNANASGYHYSHDHVKNMRNDNMRDHSHVTSLYKYLPEYGHLGDWNLMESKDYEFWWEGPIKYFKCKRCNAVGIVDSIQVYYYNRDHNIVKVENGFEQVRERLNMIDNSQKI